MSREELAELLPRWLAIALRIRRVTPGRRRPSSRVVVPAIDTGGGYRAPHREQDPSVDPREPGGGESSSAGSDHGWSNCTFSSGATAMAYQEPRGGLEKWGGDLRHSGQPDMSGGGDLYDLRAAWAEYGETLTIKSGSGWSAVVDAHGAGRAIVIQGTGNVPGSESFDGGHACCIGPETAGDGDWLWSDPLASGWQWVAPSAIRSWAERWQSSIAFAVGDKPAPPPEPPDPPPPPAAVCPPAAPLIDTASRQAVEAERDRSVGEWVEWLGAAPPAHLDAWEVGLWAPVVESLVLRSGPCDQGPAARWARGPVPDPVAAARHALDTPAAWDALAWRALLWR